VEYSKYFKTMKVTCVFFHFKVVDSFTGLTCPIAESGRRGDLKQKLSLSPASGTVSASFILKRHPAMRDDSIRPPAGIFVVFRFAVAYILLFSVQEARWGGEYPAFIFCSVEIVSQPIS
jgi:hypothetical protein